MRITRGFLSDDRDDRTHKEVSHCHSFRNYSTDFCHFLGTIVPIWLTVILSVPSLIRVPVHFIDTLPRIVIEILHKLHYRLAVVIVEI